MTTQQLAISQLYVGNLSGLTGKPANNLLVASSVGTNPNNSLEIRQDGEMHWGSGAVIPDTFLYRNAAGQLTVSNSSGGSANGIINAARVVGSSAVSSGAGAPSSAPAYLGDIYVDTTNLASYIATGTASAASWSRTSPIVFSGAGTPATTPLYLGAIYVDITNLVSYIATGTASSANWSRATPLILSGSGAPATTPVALGVIYVDTTAQDVYVSTGTASSANWTLLAGNTQSVTGAMSGAFTTSITYKLTKGPGTSVIMELPQQIGTTAAAATLTLPSIPAALRPATNTNYAILAGRDNAVDNLVRLSITTAGVVTIGVGAAGAAFTTAANGGVYECSFSYSLV